MTSRVDVAKFMLALILWASLLGITSASMPGIPIVTKSTAPSMDQIVEQMIDQFSNEPGFESWKNASWDKHSLGPGTHQSLILLSNSEGEEIGYFVLNATEAGWQLQEYGTGSYPLFHSQAWENAERYYLNEFETVWAVPSTDGEPQYIDGITNEAYPTDWVEESILDVTDGWDTSLNPHLPLLIDIEQPYTIVSKGTAISFDPYDRMSWLVSDPVEMDTLFIDTDQSFVYVSNIFSEHIYIPWAVTGFHQWTIPGEEPYTFVQIEADGITRYISAAAFQQYGEFYPVL